MDAARLHEVRGERGAGGERATTRMKQPHFKWPACLDIRYRILDGSEDSCEEEVETWRGDIVCLCLVCALCS